MGFARIVGVAQKGHVSHLLIQCVPISVLASHKNTIYRNIVHIEFSGCVDTRVSKLDAIMRPRFSTIGGGGNDGRQHDKYIVGRNIFVFR